MKGLNLELKVVNPDTVIFAIAGDVNIYNANDLRKEFDRHLVTGTKNFILNFAEMTMIDSAGIGVLFTILNRVKHMPGNVLIVQARPNVQKLFHITKVEKFFHLRSSEEEALKELGVPA